MSHEVGVPGLKKLIASMLPYAPEKIILFGSHARGDADEWSDWDIMVIQETVEPFFDRLSNVPMVVAPGVKADLFVYTPSELSEMQASGNPFIERVLAEGVVIYERGRDMLFQNVPSFEANKGSNMRKEARVEATRWLEQARANLDVARYNVQGNYHFAACFWAQQAAEQALKAFLYGQGLRFVRGHSVYDLAERCLEQKADLGLDPIALALLDRFYIPTRYPNGLPGGIPAEVYTAADSQRALELADQTFQTVQDRLAALFRADEDSN
jgi:HEPN domain-containing protein